MGAEMTHKGFLNHFATKRAWDLKNTKNDVFLARKRSRNFFDMGEGAIDSLDVCLSYEGYKSTFRQHWATLGGPKVGEIAKKHGFFQAQLAQSLNMSRNMS